MANRELEEFLMQNLGKGLGPRGVMQAAAKRFPSVTAGKFGQAMTRVANRLRARQEELDDDAAFCQRIEAIGERVGWDRNPQWKLPEMLQHAAAAGDAEAAAFLAKMQG